jgi:EpsD family peptidyl-prolyl cis-trans isomerase
MPYWQMSFAFSEPKRSTDGQDQANTSQNGHWSPLMTFWIRASAALREGLLIALCGLVLASCSKKAEVVTEAAKSQVVAKIGNQVVTVPELDNEFRVENVSTEKRRDPETIKRILTELVARKYLVQHALDAKLDREPTVLLDILRSKELVLANAMVSRDVTTKNASISKGEIDNYIANNPLKFANRRVVLVEQISFPFSSTSPALIDATREMKTLDEVDQKLTGMGVQHGRSAGAISSGDLPQELLNQITTKQADDIFFIRSGANGVFFKVTGQEAKPLEGEAAINAARQYLQQDAFKSELSMASVAANLEAQYEGEYSDIMKRDPGGPR